MGFVTDLRYGPETKRGGSIARHSDDENKSWGLVLIWSGGQTRNLLVGPKGKPAKWIVPMKSNSVTAMIGKDFQRLYTHGINKLSPNATVGIRYSLNVRYS